MRWGIGSAGTLRKKFTNHNLGNIVLLSVLTLMLIGFLSFIEDDIDYENNSSSRNELDVTIEDENSNLIELLKNGYTPYPPDPTPYTITQPDGTTFSARKVGERLGGHVETLAGYSIIEGEGGWWTYAQKNERGKLAPTGNYVGKIDPDSISGLQKNLSNSYPEVEEYPKDINQKTRAPPTNTTWKAIAIMLNFTDEDFDSGYDKAHFEQLLNSTVVASMRTYYREVSYNQFDIEVDVVGPFQSAYTMGYYGADVGPADSDPSSRDDGNVSISEMAKEAVILADPTVDFSKYDVDGDDNIDALFIIHAGPGQEGSGPSYAIWSHMSFIGYMTNDGVRATRYSTEPEDGKIGVFAHEFGHVLGLPDLYDTDYSSAGIGRWGVMAGGSWNGGGMTPAHFSAWCKIRLGWVEPTIVTSDISLFQVEIPPVWNNTYILKIWAHDPADNTLEYFLVENRQKKGFDSALPGDGVLIWHIDEAQSNNRDETHYLVDLEEADGDQELEQSSGGASQPTDPWKNDVTGFRNTTNPNSSSYNGSETGVWVWNLSGIAPDGNMSLGFREQYSGPTGIFISDPQTNDSILPVYDFTITDSDFPDEDIGPDNEGNNGSYILEWRRNGTADPWNVTPAQTMISWENGSTGIINCTMLTEGFWDFRLKILDEEGHLFYSPEIFNVAVPTDIPPVANAGFDNLTDVLANTILDGSQSTDNSGFIAWFNWSFDDGTYLNGTDSIVVHNWSAPGTYVVILNVTDSFGNWDTDIVNITVEDMGAPVTTLIIGNPKYTEHLGVSWNVTSSTVLALSSVDNYVGVNFTWYTIDGLYFNYTGPFTFSSFLEGPHDFTWGAEDNVGNNETGNFLVIVLDDTPPTTTLTIGSPRFRMGGGDLWNVTTTSLFTIGTWDQYAGIDYTWYSIDAGFSLGTTFTLAGYADGLHTIFWSSVDHLGNYEDKNITVKLDSTPPTSNIAIGNPKYRAQPFDRWNITTSTELSIKDATDGTGVGLNYTWYTIDGAFYLYSGNFTITPGLHLVTWGGIDYLNLNETGNTIWVFVDDAAPVTSLSMSNPNFGSSPTYVDSTTQISLSAVDGLGSGVASSWYKIDGGSWNLYSGWFTVSSPGLHTIYFNSTDNLGFVEIEKSQEIYVDDLAPITTISIGNPKFGSSPVYVDSSTQFTLSPTDGTGSGVDSTWFRIDSGSWMQYSSNFDIPTDGAHTIYYNASDNLGHFEITLSLEVFVDNDNPQTILTIGDPKMGNNPTRVGISTPFNLSSTDGIGSGIDSIWYNIDATTWILYTGNITLSTPGTHFIYFYSIDNLGHNEFINNTEVFVDTAPPTTTINIQNPNYGSNPTFVEPLTEINLTATDGPGTGVAETWYKIDSGSWILYTGNFVIPQEGAHTIYFYSSDILGQDEPIDSENITVDSQAPTTGISVGLPNHGLSPTFVNTTTLFTLTPDDAGGSGVVGTWYKIDLSVDISYTGPFTVPMTGAHTLSFYSKDNLDHIEIMNTYDVFVDVEEPLTTITVGDPEYSFSPTYVNSTTIFTLSASDGIGSGIASTWYWIDSGSEILYTGPFTVSQPDSHLIFYYSVDHIGNEEVLRGLSIFVDSTPPDTTLTVGDPKYGILPTYVNLETELHLEATDDTGCGVEFIWYKIESGSWIEFTGNFTLPSPGTHTVYYYSQDYLGQSETVKQEDIVVDITPPSTTHTIGSKKYRANDFDLWNVTSSALFELITLDTDVQDTWFTINGKYYEDLDFSLGYFGLSEGFYTITWGSIDKLGNNETGNSITVFLDTSYPTTELTVGNPKYRAKDTDYWKITKETDFNLYSPYQKSGVNKTWYTIDGDYYEGTVFDLSSYIDAQYIITYGTIDNLGHNETANQIIIILDSDMQYIDLVLGEPKYRASDTHLFNVTTLTTFSLLIFDAYLDVDHTWYTINGDYYEGTIFTLDGYDEGLQTVTFGTYDIFGTSETWGTILVYLDDSPPDTDIEPQGPKVQDQNKWKVTKDTMFSLSSDDEYSGVSNIWYTIQGMYYIGNQFDLGGYEDGIYTISWGAYDNLNFNETGHDLSVVVDNTAPEISIKIGTPNATVNGEMYITSETEITLISSDPYGTTMLYSLDGGSTFTIYTAPFTVDPQTTKIVYYGEDDLGNRADFESYEVLVNDNDTDSDGTFDLLDEDDDNDGLLDSEEDVNQNGILDDEESDPLNPDTDSDGHIDSKDKFPQDASRYRDPTDWEKIPLLGGFEQSLCINLLIIGIILLIILIYLFRRYRMHRAKSSWEKEPESEQNSQNNK
jgi:M6 family metalloprotease-like protein